MGSSPQQKLNKLKLIIHIRTEEEIKELEEKVEFIKITRNIHHSAYKQSLMELLYSNTKEVIDFEYQSSLKQKNNE